MSRHDDSVLHSISEDTLPVLDTDADLNYIETRITDAMGIPGTYVQAATTVSPDTFRQLNSNRVVESIQEQVARQLARYAGQGLSRSTIQSMEYDLTQGVVNVTMRIPQTVNYVNVDFNVGSD